MNKETPREAVKNVLEQNERRGLWQPKGLGLSYVKSGAQTVILISQENIPTSADARVRMRMLIERIGWTVDESICEIIDVEYLTLEQKHAKEVKILQDMAKNWECSCGMKLSKFPLMKHLGFTMAMKKWLCRMVKLELSSNGTFLLNALTVRWRLK